MKRIVSLIVLAGTITSAHAALPVATVLRGAGVATGAATVFGLAGAMIALKIGKVAAVACLGLAGVDFVLPNRLPKPLKKAADVPGKFVQYLFKPTDKTPVNSTANFLSNHGRALGITAGVVVLGGLACYGLYQKYYSDESREDQNR